MATYLALVDGQPGAYGIVFPDAPGCAAMGKTVSEALRNAEVALAEWIKHSDANESGRPKHA